MNRKAVNTALKPAAYLLLVVMQWAAWSQLGLNVAPDSGLAEFLAPGIESTRSDATIAVGEQVIRFDRVPAAPDTAEILDFCRAMKSWPLPGCQVS